MASLNNSAPSGTTSANTNSNAILPVQNTRSTTTRSATAASASADAGIDVSPSEKDATSTAESSSSEDDDDDEDEESSSSEDESPSTNTIPTIPAQKPTMRAAPGGDLSSRLAAFLPQLAASNAELEKLKQRGELTGIEDVEEGKDYIEMDLGLGVLEEQKLGSEGQGDEKEEEEEEEQDTKEEGEEDVLGKMMGIKRDKGGAGISEV